MTPEQPARRTRRPAARRRRSAARPGLHPRGRRHGQDARDHPPHRLRCRDRRVRAEPRHGADLHQPRGGGAARPAASARRRRRRGAHLPRCGALAAQLLLAAGGRRSAAGVLDGKGRILGHAAERLRLKLDTATLRDVAAEIEWRKVSGLSIEQYAARARRRVTCPAPSTAEQARRPAAGVRRPQGRAQAVRLRGRAARLRRDDRDRAGRGHAGARAVPLLRRRRVPGRLAAAAAAPRPLARRPARRLRRRRREPDHLLVRRRAQRLPARFRAPHTTTRRSCASSRTTGRPRRSWMRPTGSCAADRARSPSTPPPSTEPGRESGRRRAGNVADPTCLRVRSGGGARRRAVDRRSRSRRAAGRRTSRCSTG